jgi:YjbR
MTADDFRRLVLDLDGTEERSHMGHPDFRANGRIFASLHSNDTKGMVKLAPEEQREFMRSQPAMFEPSAGAWGRQGCTNVLLAAATAAAVRGAIILAWQAALDKPPAGRRKTGKTTRSASRARPSRKR